MSILSKSNIRGLSVFIKSPSIFFIRYHFRGFNIFLYRTPSYWYLWYGYPAIFRPNIYFLWPPTRLLTFWSSWHSHFHNFCLILLKKVTFQSFSMFLWFLRIVHIFAIKCLLSTVFSAWKVSKWLQSTWPIQIGRTLDPCRHPFER